MIDLHGKWEIQGFFGETAYPRMQGDVPGSAYTAALAAGIAQSDEIGLSRLHNAWLSGCRWRYTRRFFVQEDIAENRYFLHIGKTAPGCSLRINEKRLGTVECYCAALDITNALRRGDNEIVLEMDGPAALQDIRIDCFSRARIAQADLFWDEEGFLHSQLCAEVYEPGKYILQYRLMRGAETAHAEDIALELAAGENHLSHVLAVNDAQPWGGADSPVYTCILQLEKLSVRAHRRLLRTGYAVWKQDESGNILLHGKKRFLRGAVWHSNYRADKRALLEQLRRCHINALRVTDLECDAFYDACDELGIGVWQELSASATPADWARVLRHLGSHPCLLLADPGALAFADGSPADARHPEAHAFLAALEPIAHIPLRAASPSGERGDQRGPNGFASTGQLALHCKQDGAKLRNGIAFPAFSASPEAFAGDRSLFPVNAANPFWALRPALLGERLTGLPAGENDLATHVRMSRFFQAQALRMQCESLVLRQADASGAFVDGIFAENGAFDSSLFDASLPRPACAALRAAFAPNALLAQLSDLCFAPGDALEADIALCCEKEDIYTVDCMLYDAHGQVAARESFTTRATLPVSRIGRFSFPVPSGAQGLYLLRLETTVGERKLRGEYVVAVSGDRSLLPLRNAPMLHMKTAQAAEGWFLVNDADALALGLHYNNADISLPAGCSALLPREQIRLEVAGDYAELPRPEALNPLL